MRYALLAAVIVLASPSAHADPAADRSAIMRTYDSLKTSLAHGSVQPLRAAMAPRMALIKEDNSTSTLTPSGVADIPSSPAMISMSADVRVARLVVDADVASAIVTIDLHVSNRNGQTGLPYKTELISSVIHDWARTAQGWRIERETEVATRQIVDPDAWAKILTSPLDKQNQGGNSVTAQAALAVMSRHDMMIGDHIHAQNCLNGIGYGCGR